MKPHNLCKPNQTTTTFFVVQVPLQRPPLQVVALPLLPPLLAHRLLPLLLLATLLLLLRLVALPVSTPVE